ncbi:DUF4755 domain-containing protein [Xanthomonadaceae bacterium JHOS43]|nr:DUF4755 domain-containing protein [Xanthomonadaceae bacterium JHOS43]
MFRVTVGVMFLLASPIVSIFWSFALGFLLGMVSIALIVWGLTAHGKNAQKQQVSFAEGFDHIFMSGGTGIAVSASRRIVRLKDASRIKDYQFGDVRSWEAKLLTGGMTHVYGGAGLSGINANAQAMGANIGQAMRNKSESGLFLSVKDIDKPTWRINMLNKTDLDRWMEVLQQFVNEAKP